MVAVGKAVWNEIWLLKLSGPVSVYNNAVFLGTPQGTQKGHSSGHFPLSHAERTLKTSCYIFFIVIFHIALLFWSRRVCSAVCRLELNAADWNLNCDLAVANCESEQSCPSSLSSSIILELFYFPYFFFFSLFFFFPFFRPAVMFYLCLLDMFWITGVFFFFKVCYDLLYFDSSLLFTFLHSCLFYQH